MGGLARNASVANSIRATQEESVLLLDCGGMFETRRFARDGLVIIAEKGLSAMNRMGYDAMNLGREELFLGQELLQKSRRGPGLSFL